MKHRITTGIFFFLFVLTAAGVFAAFSQNPRQGIPAISITSQPGSADETAEPHQGCELRLRIFTADSPVGFNGGNNLYRYADNNPILFTDPMGLSACYKDLVVRVLNYYDKVPYPWNDYVLRSAFGFFGNITDGPQLRILPSYAGDHIAPLIVKNGTWTLYTEFVFNSFSRDDNDDERFANIIIAETNWPTSHGYPAGLTPPGKNQAIISAKYYAHEDPIKLGWSIAHETGHILLGQDHTGGLMYPGNWSATEFIPNDLDRVKKALAK